MAHATGRVKARVYHVRPSRSKVDTDAVFCQVSSSDYPDDDRVFVLHATADSHQQGSTVEIVINENGSQASWG